MLSTTPQTGQDEREQRLARLLADAGANAEMVSFTVLGDSVRLEGCVGSYSAKRALENTAREAGFRQVENCLRVIPALAVGSG